MTDNEIINALEHLVKNANCHIPITGKMLLEDVLEVLNRQNAQIEGLQDEVVTKTDMLNKQKAEIERYLHSIKLLEKDVQTAKAENEKNERIIELDNKLIKTQSAEIERLQKAGEEAVSCFTRMESLYKIKCKELEVAKSEAIKEFEDELIKVLKDALYGLDIKQKTISREEMRKRFESLMHKDIPEVIEYVKNKMVGDDNA